MRWGHPPKPCQGRMTRRWQGTDVFKLTKFSFKVCPRQTLKDKLRKKWWLGGRWKCFSPGHRCDSEREECRSTQETKAEAAAEAETLNNERNGFVPLWFGQWIYGEDKQVQIDYLGGKGFQRKHVCGRGETTTTLVMGLTEMKGLKKEGWL